MNKKHKKPSPDYVFDIGDEVIILDSAAYNSLVLDHCIGNVYILEYFDGEAEKMGIYSIKNIFLESESSCYLKTTPDVSSGYEYIGGRDFRLMSKSYFPYSPATVLTLAEFCILLDTESIQTFKFC